MSFESREMLISTFQKMVEGIESYTMILLDVDGTILTWNKGVEKLKGYQASEIIGHHISMFYMPEDRQTHLPERLLEKASILGRAITTGKRIRKNGTIFWGSIEIVSVKDDQGNVIGFTNLARELKDETDIGHFWFDNDGILHTRASRVPQTPERIAEFRAMLSNSLHSGKLCCIADLREAILTDEGMSFAQPEVENIYRAVAYISDPEPDVNTVRVMAMMPQSIPTRVFQNRESARSWIRQYLNHR
jgi:PAS domain S-box-containing protein